MKVVAQAVRRALTADEEAEAQRIADIVVGKMRAEAVELSRMLVSKSNGELFGQTEFQVRDAVHRVGAPVDAKRAGRRPDKPGQNE